MKAVSRVALIVNSMSRTGANAFEEACAALGRAGIEVDAHAVTDPDRLDTIVKQALELRPDAIVLGGGDGTISGLVDHFVECDVPLGLLPLGTANSFVRSLGIPIDLESAVAVIAAGKRRAVDLGMIDHDYFANCAAIGMSSLIADTIPHKLKRWGGRFGYAMWAGIQAMRFRPFKLTLTEAGGKATTLDALEVRIANGSFHGGTELVSDASVDLGRIVVQVVEGRTRLALATSWALSLLGMRRARETTRDFHAASIHLECHPPQSISIDGEVLARTPVTARAAARAIEVLVP